MSRRSELFRALGAVAEGPCRPELARGLGLGRSPAPSEHTEVFVLQTHPYASVHLGAEGMLGGEAADRVAGFWRTVGVVPPDPSDHLGVLLAGYAGLGDEAALMGNGRRRHAVERAAAVLLWEHLASWTPVYLEAVRSLDHPFYRGWAELVLATLADEADRGADEPLPTALRMAPASVPIDDGRERFVAGLLSPMRSGLVVTRADLGRACRELGLGLRQGERAYLVGAMLDQSPRSSIAWLAGHARGWALRHAGLRGTALEGIGAWWEARARQTADSLDGLAVGANRGGPSDPVRDTPSRARCQDPTLRADEVGQASTVVIARSVREAHLRQGPCQPTREVPGMVASEAEHDRQQHQAHHQGVEGDGHGQDDSHLFRGEGPRQGEGQEHRNHHGGS